MRGLLLLFGALVALASVTAVATASGAKPTIGPARAVPAQAVAGSSLSVAFRVAHAQLATFAVTLGGKPQHHSDSFRGGLARTTIALPASAAGKSLSVALTARSSGASATKRVSFAVHAGAPPSLEVSDASATEGNSATTPMSFDVSLSQPAAKAVSVRYATADGTAVAPGDYVAASGTLTFNPGETTKSIAVQVVGDTTLEPNETFSLTLSNPVGATIDTDTATGTILNDDTAAPVSAGSWQGATQEGNYVFFTVTPSRTITEFRSNSLTEDCGNGEYLQGSISWGAQEWPIGSDGSLAAHYDWTGSETIGDITLTAESWKITGQFSTATTINGTIAISDTFTYQGGHYSCGGSVTYSATRQG